MKRVLFIAFIACTIIPLEAQQTKSGGNKGRNGGHAGFVGQVQGAQPAADAAFLATVISRSLIPGSSDVGTLVVTSPGTGEKTLRVTMETKVMRNGAASNLKYAQAGDTASMTLKEKGPFVKFLTLTSAQAGGAGGPALTPEQAKAKKAAADAKLLKWHMDQAAKGDARGLFEMGRRYELGDGVEMNKEKAIDYYTKASAAGNEDAKTALKRLSA